MIENLSSKIPIPTDNVFKFYALFSLLGLIFCLGALIYTNKLANDFAFSVIVEIETLKQDPVPTQAQKMRLAALERQLQISQSDRKFYSTALSVLTALASYGMYYEFRKWHRDVQPVVDEAARIQLEIAKLQLEKMRSEQAKRDA